MTKRPWTAAEDALARALAPGEVARRTGRSVAAVRARRSVLGCEPLKRPWTAREDELARALPPAEAARTTGRTERAVRNRRHVLGTAAESPRPGRAGG
jgi:hypothetical protein